MGYRPHPVARMLTAGSTATIGILSPQALGTVFANPFFSLFAEGVASVTEERGFGLLFISPLHGSLARALDRATVDGIVAVGLDERHPEVESIRKAGLPVVLVDAPAWEEHGAVGVDDEGGARAAAGICCAWATECSHQRGAAHLRRPLPESVAPSHARLPRTLAAAGVELGPQDVVVSPASFEGGETAMLRAWEDGLRPTAVLSMSDAAAAGVVQAARVLGLRVPDDLSVVGFDDLPLTRFTDPPLTTVHQPVRRKGEEAARLLLAALNAPRERPRRSTGSWRRGWWSVARRLHRPPVDVWRWSPPDDIAGESIKHPPWPIQGPASEEVRSTHVPSVQDRGAGRFARARGGRRTRRRPGCSARGRAPVAHLQPGRHRARRPQHRLRERRGRTDLKITVLEVPFGDVFNKFQLEVARWRPDLTSSQ
jgi:DNA-binding LacI/PurR family transcriptional regulator